MSQIWKAAIENSKTPFVLVIKSYCPHSMDASDYIFRALTEAGVKENAISNKFTTIELDKDLSNKEMIEFQNFLEKKSGIRTVPQLFRRGGQFIGDGEKISNMYKRGQLRQMFSE